MIAGAPARMMTVTLARELPQSQAKKQMRALRRWMTRHGLIERAGWVREYGPRGGRLHFHCVITTRAGFWPYAALQKAARRCGLGNVDVTEEIGHEQVARYVAKYLAKGLGEGTSKLDRGGRRFHCPEPAPKTEGWTFETTAPMPAPEAYSIRLVLGRSGVFAALLESG